jgi:hypothetical protein
MARPVDPHHRPRPAALARRELALESAIARLDRYDLLILDDIAYVTKDHAQTSVLFELIAARYEQRSLLITANRPFRRVGQDLPRSRHDARRQRPPRPSLDHPQDERPKLSPQSRRRPQADQDGRPLTQLQRNSKRPPMIDDQRQSILTLSVNQLAKPRWPTQSYPQSGPPLLILMTLASHLGCAL